VPHNRSQAYDLGRLLAAVENAPPIDVVEVLTTELAEMLDARYVSLLIATFDGDTVSRMSHVTTGLTLSEGHNERTDPVVLNRSIYEQVLFSQTVERMQIDEDWVVLIPVTERGDAIGILELSLTARPDNEVLNYLRSAAHALAYVLVASRRHTDLFEWAQRSTPFTVAAEIQRRLLPSAYTAEGGAFTVAGWLEPSHDAGGDTFDYSIDREYLYASITDAMGHGTEAALLATLTVNTLRNQRRGLGTPPEQANAANAVLLDGSRPDQFVTCLFLRVRLADGNAELVNAGHPPPYLLRTSCAETVDLGAQLPLGVKPVHYRAQSLQLQPGDRLVLITDGYLDRNASNVDICKVLAATADRHPRQIVQELATRVLDATGGELLDDTTVLCIDWHGANHQRDATGGASHDQTTST
jgi:serine phosphatase RsbU (regulator of sigma subunit)